MGIIWFFQCTDTKMYNEIVRLAFSYPYDFLTYKAPLNDSAIFPTKQRKLEKGGKNRIRLETITKRQLSRDKKLGWVLSSEKGKGILSFSFARTGIFVTNRIAILDACFCKYDRKFVIISIYFFRIYFLAVLSFLSQL